MPSRNTSQSLNALPPGTVLRDYVIESELGSGGFSIVYLARHHLNPDWLYAIKEFLPGELAVRARDGTTVHPVKTEAEEAFDDGLRRFRDEAEQLRKFRNEPYVVSCLNYFEQNGTAYLVMDHDDGLPLLELLRRREEAGQPFTETDLLAVVEPLLEGLTAVHRAGVLHRDIKPGNIFVRRQDDITGRPAHPVLIDFGAAKQNYLARHSRSRAPYTPGYAAYEQVSSDGDIGPWTDVYAVGALMWRMVAGGCPGDSRLLVLDGAEEVDGAELWSSTPRAAEKRAYALHRGRSDPMVSAAELGAGRFSLTLLQVIDRCLALYPEDRVQNCEELRKLLQTQTTSESAARKGSQQPDGDARKTNQDRSPGLRSGLIRAIAVMAFHLGVTGLALRGAANLSGESAPAEQWVFLFGEALILGSITFTIATVFHWSLGWVGYFKARRNWITWLVAAGAIAGWSNGADDGVLAAAIIAIVSAVFGAIIWAAIFLSIGLLWRRLKRLFVVGGSAQETVAKKPEVDDQTDAKVGQKYTNTGGWIAAALFVVAIAITMILVAVWERPSVEGGSSNQRLLSQGPPFTVRTDPPQAQVVFTNHEEQYEPGIALAEGSYHVEVSAPGYEPRREWLDHAEAIPEHQISLDPIGQAFTVEVEPSGARVRILNIAPVYEPGMMLSAGSYRVEVSAPGYEPVVEAVWHDTASPTVHRVELSLSLAQLPDNGRATGTLEPGDYELPSGAYGDLWTVQARAGQTLNVDLISPNFDALLTLIDTQNSEVVAEDDDSGEETDSRIRLDLSENGEYLIVASSYAAGEVGDYELRVDATLPERSSVQAERSEENSSRSTTFTRGSHEDDVLRLQGTPTSITDFSVLGYETWRYGRSSVEISTSSRRVTLWDNSGSNLRVRLEPGINTTNSSTFTRGSHEDDVLRLQGTPTSITDFSVLGYETWRYGRSSVEISTSSRRVTLWDNSGSNLRVRLEPGINTTNSSTFTRGSHEDDVLRLQGTPTSIVDFSVLGYETWRYRRSSVEIATSSRRVTEWDNSGGNLMVR